MGQLSVAKKSFQTAPMCGVIYWKSHPRVQFNSALLQVQCVRGHHLCQKIKGGESAIFVHCKYLQPVYSHWLCYICHCNLAVIITANDCTYDNHWHWGVQLEIKYSFGLCYVPPNYSWKRNTAKSCTEYSQNICSVVLRGNLKVLWACIKYFCILFDKIYWGVAQAFI